MIPCSLDSYPHKFGKTHLKHDLSIQACYMLRQWQEAMSNHSITDNFWSWEIPLVMRTEAILRLCLHPLGFYWENTVFTIMIILLLFLLKFKQYWDLSSQNCKEFKQISDEHQFGMAFLYICWKKKGVGFHLGLRFELDKCSISSTWMYNSLSSEVVLLDQQK